MDAQELQHFGQSEDLGEPKQRLVGRAAALALPRPRRVGDEPLYCPPPAREGAPNNPKLPDLCGSARDRIPRLPGQPQRPILGVRTSSRFRVAISANDVRHRASARGARVGNMPQCWHGLGQDSPKPSPSLNWPNPVLQCQATATCAGQTGCAWGLSRRRPASATD